MGEYGKMVTFSSRAQTTTVSRNGIWKRMCFWQLWKVIPILCDFLLLVKRPTHFFQVLMIKQLKSGLWIAAVCLLLWKGTKDQFRFWHSLKKRAYYYQVPMTMQ